MNKIKKSIFSFCISFKCYTTCFHYNWQLNSLSEKLTFWKMSMGFRISRIVVGMALFCFNDIIWYKNNNFLELRCLSKLITKSTNKKKIHIICLWDHFCITFDTLGVSCNFLLTTMLILGTKQTMPITFWKHRTSGSFSLCLFFSIKLFTAFLFHFVVGTTTVSVLVKAKMHLTLLTVNMWEVIASAVLASLSGFLCWKMINAIPSHIKRHTAAWPFTGWCWSRFWRG